MERNSRKKSPLARRLYLDKRTLARVVHKGFTKRAAQAMQTMGYLVIAKDGFIVKKFQDGRIEVISEIKRPELPIL